MQKPPEKYIVTASDVAAVEAGYYWSQPAIDHVLKFASTLRNPMHPEKPYELLPWQLEFVEKLFGWRRPDGRRRFSRLNVWISKKNGKSSFLAFLGLYFLLADGEPRPGCYAVSTTGNQSEEIFVEANCLTKGTAWRKVLDVKKFRKQFLCAANDGIFQTLASNADGAEGLKGSFVCCDEIHRAFVTNPKLYKSLRYAGSGRKQPITATISTAGDDRQSLAFKIYIRAKQILAGEVIDLDTLALVYECEDKDEYTLEEMTAANPGIGYVLDADQLWRDYLEAKSSDYLFEDFKRYRLNVWTKRSTAWLNGNKFLGCCEIGFDKKQLAGLDCFVGVDLSGVLDLTCACAVIPMPDGRFYIEPHFWLPTKDIDTRSIKEMDYKAAAMQGHITLIPGPQVDYSFVSAWIAGLAEKYNLRQIGFDPWRCTEVAKALEAEGFDCVAVAQGWKISEPSTKFETLIETSNLIHRGNTVMSWCVDNVEIKRDPNGKIRPVKSLERHKRIDGVIAAIMGLYLAMFAEAPDAIDAEQVAKEMEFINGLYGS